MLNLAVVGHVEWVTHTDAPFIPPAGEIVHLTDPLTEPATKPCAALLIVGTSPLLADRTVGADPVALVAIVMLLYLSVNTTPAAVLVRAQPSGTVTWNPAPR